MKNLKLFIVLAMLALGSHADDAAKDATEKAHDETKTAEKASTAKVAVSQKDRLQKKINACMPAQGIGLSTVGTK